MKRIYMQWFIVVLTITAMLAAAPAGIACTRIFYNKNAKYMVVGRTMDWPESTQATLTVFPRGTKRDGGLLGTERVIRDNPATWSAKYGSIVTTVYGLGAVDGLNETGLGMHLLYLNVTDFGPRRAGVPALHAGLWGQYVLDNAATVKEALALLKGVDLVMVEAHGRKATVHLVLEDASGDSAVIEHVNGRVVVHHGSEYRVVTNDPTYDEQLALLAKLDLSNPSSEIPLPGNVNPRDRFQRASYFLSLLPEMKNEPEAIAGVLAIARNVSVPFGAPYRGFGIYNTEYRTALDLANKRYFFEMTTSPNLIWATLGSFNLSPGAPVMWLNPDNINLYGNVNSSFEVLKQVPF